MIADLPYVLLSLDFGAGPIEGRRLIPEMPHGPEVAWRRRLERGRARECRDGERGGDRRAQYTEYSRVPTFTVTCKCGDHLTAVYCRVALVHRLWRVGGPDVSWRPGSAHHRGKSKVYLLPLYELCGAQTRD